MSERKGFFKRLFGGSSPEPQKTPVPTRASDTCADLYLKQHEVEKEKLEQLGFDTGMTGWVQRRASGIVAGLTSDQPTMPKYLEGMPIARASWKDAVNQGQRLRREREEEQRRQQEEERQAQVRAEQEKQSEIARQQETKPKSPESTPRPASTPLPKPADAATGAAQTAEGAAMGRRAWDYAQRSGMGTPGSVPNPFNAPPGYYQGGPASNRPPIGADGRPIPPVKPPGW